MSNFRYSLTVAGNVLTEKIYEKCQYVLYEANERKPRRELSLEEQKEIRRRSALRARKTLVDAVNANFGWVRRGFRYGDKSVKFLTLTYKENMTDYARLSGDFDLFKHRLEYHLREKIQYVCVPERQERGAWHLHVLLFCSFIPIDTLKRLWNETQGQGGFNVKRVQHVHNVGKYIGKYVGKDFEDADGLAGRKRFWCSQGFTKSVSRFRLKENPALDVKGVFSKRKLLASCYESEFESEHTGKVSVRQYVVFPSLAAKRLVENLSETLVSLEKDADATFQKLADRAAFLSLPRTIQQMRRKQQGRKEEFNIAIRNESSEIIDSDMLRLLFARAFQTQISCVENSVNEYDGIQTLVCRISDSRIS